MFKCAGGEDVMRLGASAKHFAGGEEDPWLVGFRGWIFGVPKVCQCDQQLRMLEWNAGMPRHFC